MFEDNHIGFAPRKIVILSRFNLRLSVSLTPKVSLFQTTLSWAAATRPCATLVRPPGKKERDLPSSPDEVCGGNDNIFQNNFIEHVCFETDDSGAFCA
eukprot:COSAG04_NODE_4306_length_2168_cov_2.937168_2_plen_98_part_00